MVTSWKGGREVERDEGIRGRNRGRHSLEMGLGEWWGCVEGQDVCLPMSRDSERKRRGEWDERGEEGDKR